MYGTVQNWAVILTLCGSERVLVVSTEMWGGGWHQASASACLPLAAPIGLSPPLILTLCGSERVLVVSTEMWGGGLAPGLGICLFAFGSAYWPLATAHSDPLWVRTCFGCVNGDVGGGLAPGLGICLFAFGSAYWPLATAHSDPLWVRTCFGCVNGDVGGGGWHQASASACSWRIHPLRSDKRTMPFRDLPNGQRGSKVRDPTMWSDTL